MASLRLGENNTYQDMLKTLLLRFYTAVLRTPKGWIGPKEAEGFWRAHQVPFQIIENTNHAHESGIDRPEFTNWKWPY